MTTYSSFLLAMSGVDERGIREIDNYVAALRSANLVAIGPDTRGPIAVRDVATTIIALSACVTPTDAPSTARGFRALLPTVRGEVVPERFLPPPVLESTDFGTAIECLIEGEPSLADRCQRHSARFELVFSWGFRDAGAVRIWSGRSLRAEIVFVDHAAPREEFCNRSTVVTLGLQAVRVLRGIVGGGREMKDPLIFDFGRARASKPTNAGKEPPHAA